MAKGLKTGGRKRGAVNVRDRERQVVASGKMTPLAYMLGVLNDSQSTRAEKRWAAQAAAPFVHPKLQTTTVQGDANRPVNVSVRFVS